MQQITLLTILRHRAKSWWYHRELRAQGRADLASTLEERMVNELLDAFEEAKRVGAIAYLSNGFWLNGLKDYDNSPYSGLPLACWVAGIPMIWLKGIREEAIAFTNTLPEGDRAVSLIRLGAPTFNWARPTPVILPNKELVMRSLEWSGQFEKVLDRGRQVLALDRCLGRWRVYSADLYVPEFRVFWSEAPHYFVYSAIEALN